MTMHNLRILADETELDVEVPHGANLREVLLQEGNSPYTWVTRRLNCGGRGICATCGVWIEEGEPAPEHWHDRIGSRFGYPRLSCQVTIDRDMTVRILTDKWIWGRRDPNRRWQTSE
jgi:ferredoxin